MEIQTEIIHPQEEEIETEHPAGVVVHSLDEKSDNVRTDAPVYKHDQPEPTPSVRVFDNPFSNSNDDDDTFEITSQHENVPSTQPESAEVEVMVLDEPKEKPYDPKEELKRNRLRALSLNFKTQKGLEELEREPAYMRRDHNYEEIEAEEEVSQYSASSKGISTENSFLHKGVD